MDTPTLGPSLGTVSYDLTLDDCENSMREPLMRKAMWRNALGTGRGQLVCWVIIGGAGGTLGGSAVTQVPSAAAMVLGCFLGAVVIPGFMLLILFGNVRQHATTARKAIARGAYGNVLGPYTVDLREDGIQWRGPNGMSLTRWTAIQRIDRGTHGLLFFLGPISMAMIPHRALASGSEFESRARELHAKADGHTS